MQAVHSQVGGPVQHERLQARHTLMVRGLSKSYLSPGGEKIDVLRNLSLSASDGEAIAIIGASGAGKSTLLHLLGGLELADSGTIELNGISIERSKPASLARLRNQSIGFIFQFHHLLSDLTALENVALPLMIAGRSRKEAIRSAKEALRNVGLADRLDHSITYLSGGEQQRVAVARALISAPTLILADEPTGNLDTVIEEEISGLLTAFARQRGKLLVVATHNQRLARMCDRILLLKDGSLEELSQVG
jgi:lipoprotein-releasing system ATP-binding protein